MVNLDESNILKNLCAVIMAHTDDQVFIPYYGDAQLSITSCDSCESSKILNTLLLNSKCLDCYKNCKGATFSCILIFALNNFCWFGAIHKIRDAIFANF